MPDVPPDLTFPMREILANTACELQSKLRELSDKRYARFKADSWLITVSLQPKTDYQITPAVGFTRKVPTHLANPVRITTWTVNSPGAQLDAKTERSSGVAFVFKSPALMKDTSLICDH